MMGNSAGMGVIHLTVRLSEESDMIDINATDFVEAFKLENAVVGLIGQGFVGSSMKAYFSRKLTVLTYDKYKSENSSSTLEELVKGSDVIFVCVPTPMRKTGECYTGIVEDVLHEVDAIATQIGRPGHSFVMCVKSTVPPGFTQRISEMHPSLRIVFSPEFLTEKNAVQDMIKANRVIVGGSYEDARVVLQYFLAVDRRRVDEGKCVLIATSSQSAEMAKLFSNGLLFAKVLFSNDIYALCKELGINYDEVRVLAALDPRVGASHTAVPGPDGEFGASGSCFPKDLNSLIFLSKQLGVGEKMFSAVWQRNLELRKNHDWEQLSGRAVCEEK